MNSVNPLFRFSNNDQYLVNNNYQYLIITSIWPFFINTPFYCPPQIILRLILDIKSPIKT